MGIQDNEKGVKMVNERPQNETNSYNEPRFCPNCGANTNPMYKFCKNCGHQLIAFVDTINKSKSHGQVEKVANDVGGESGIDKVENVASDVGGESGVDKVENVANESKNVPLPKIIKIPTPATVNNQSIKKSPKLSKLTKLEDTNLNIDKNIQKENQENNEDINNIQKENQENNEDINNIDNDSNEENGIGFSVADEIYKFYKLKKEGVITSEEFEKKKKQLLEI